MNEVPDYLARARKQLCRQAGCVEVVDYFDACIGCPAGHWGPTMKCTSAVPATTPRPVPDLHTAPLSPTGGAGTELKRLLALIGIRPEGNCACNARAAEMDSRGPDWCASNLDRIVGWLHEEADRRKLLFSHSAARQLVKLAIRRARRTAHALILQAIRKARATPPPPTP